MYKCVCVCVCVCVACDSRLLARQSVGVLSQSSLVVRHMDNIFWGVGVGEFSNYFR